MVRVLPLGDDEPLGLLVAHSTHPVDTNDVAPLHRLLLLRHKISLN